MKTTTICLLLMAIVSVFLTACGGGSSTATYTVGGTVTGLTGALALQDNSGDKLTISADGAFTFGAALTDRTGYNVTVATQPSGQTCTVLHGSGTVLGGNVRSVAVDCVPTSVGGNYSVGGMVLGLTGTLVLQNNGGDGLTISTAGAFTFSQVLADGAAYDVTVATQPSGQTCTVPNGSGTVSGSAVAVTVICAPSSPSRYTVGGTVSGLAGTLVLQNNGGNDRSLTADGSFIFSEMLTDGSAYGVTVATQPSGQTCTVSNGSGTVSGANVGAVAISCTASGGAAATYKIGGAVSGLTGTLVLQNDGGDNLSIAADGAFSFSTALANGAAYSVSVATLPSGQTCTVSRGNGTVSGSDVTTVAVVCVTTPAGAPAAPTVSVSYSVKSVNLTWSAVSGATYYNVLKNPDGASGYTPLVSNSTATSYQDAIAAHRADWLNMRYIVEACNASGCAASNEITSLDLIKAIGYFKASNTGSNDLFGYALSLSADGNTLAVGAAKEDSGAMGINMDQADDCSAAAPVNCAADSGAVYVFTHSGSTWSQQAYVKASNTGANDGFGHTLSLSSDGNTLAVGAADEDSAAVGIDANQVNDCAAAAPTNCAANSGAVYVFTRSGSTWTQQAYVKTSNTEAGDNFGSVLSLSSDGNTLAVGARLEDSGATGIGGNQADNSATNSGAVYVFSRSGSLWSQQAYVKASNTAAGDTFGSALGLASDGNTLAVGAADEDSAATGIDANQVNDCAAPAPTNCAASSGAVYIFNRSGSTWTQQAYVKASNTGAGDNFGSALTLSGDGATLAVGAWLEDSAATNIGGTQTDNIASASGAVYVFSRSSSTWSQQAYVKASNTQTDDYFGFVLGLSDNGDILAAGASGESSAATGVGGNQSDNSDNASGAVYIFSRSGTTWSPQAYVKAPNTNTLDQFGSALSLSGDGQTLAVGAYLEDSAATGVGGNQTGNSANDSGAVYLY